MSLSTIRRAFSLTHSLILPRSYSLSRNIRSEAIWIPTRVKEKGFWMAALEHNNTYSLTDDSKVYHPIKFGEDYPGYRPKGDEMPTDRPMDNDQRFCYYTNVRVWKTSQVPEERTLA